MFRPIRGHLLQDVSRQDLVVVTTTELRLYPAVVRGAFITPLRDAVIAPVLAKGPPRDRRFSVILMCHMCATSRPTGGL